MKSISPSIILNVRIQKNIIQSYVNFHGLAIYKRAYVWRKCSEIGDAIVI